MKEIITIGKCIDNRKWVSGYKIKTNPTDNPVYIQDVSDKMIYEVDPETLSDIFINVFEKHGEWLYQSPTENLNGCWICSNCGNRFYNHDRNRDTYCSNCGARMKS